MAIQFNTPTRRQAMDHHFWGRYGSQEGRSIVRVSGVLTYLQAPTVEELAGLTEGVDYFIGGRRYPVTVETLAELVSGGFTTGNSTYYGFGTYGSGPYGG